MSLGERFWAKVDRSGECWIWTASLTSAGYGQINVDGRPLGAHRAAVELATGVAIPPGMQVDHKCHVRACVNPDHLQVVTRKSNQQNRSGATRANRSGVRGVGWHEKSSKWRVFVGVNGKYHHGGLFADVAHAEAAAIELRNALMTNNLADRAA